jgi:nitrous oxidase accessory protein
MRLLILILVLVLAWQTTPHGILPDISTANATPPNVCPTCQYKSIQEGVDKSLPGATLVVGPGTYNESVLITIRLTLIGSGPASTTIRAPFQVLAAKPTINITNTNNVIIANFTLETLNPYANITHIQDSTNVIVANNTITGSADTGIYILRGTGNRIENNTITQNPNAVAILNCTKCTVRNNSLTGNTNGLLIGKGSRNQIVNNTMTRNTLGIEISASTQNLVKGNSIADGEGGIDIIDGSSGNNVTRNRVLRQTDSGISLRDADSNKIFENLVQDNHLPNRTNQTIPSVGLKLQNSTRNMFYLNNLVRNDRHMFAVCTGTQLTGAQCSLSRNDMTMNTWDNGTRGNFWDTYGPQGGVDKDGDGIGDTLLPFPCPNGGSLDQTFCSVDGDKGVDYKPLVTPWPLHFTTILIRTTPPRGYSPLQVTFNATAYGELSPFQYQWKFGDGLVSSTQNTTHTYNLPGTYIATILVADSSTASTGANVTVSVLRPAGGFLITVKDNRGDPVQGVRIASVTVPSGQEPVNISTNSSGKASLDSILEGFYIFTATKTGYDTVTFNITITRGQNETRTVSLSTTTKNSGLSPYVIGGGVIAALAIIAALLLAWRRKTPSAKPSQGKLNRSQKKNE